MEGPSQDKLKGLQFIQELAIQLRVSKECLATANYYYQIVIMSLVHSFMLEEVQDFSFGRRLCVPCLQSFGTPEACRACVHEAVQH